MPILSILAHGATAGVAPTRNSRVKALRGDTVGWSTGATRRNTAFLRTVDHDQLKGQGYAITLTLRDCPKTPELWKRVTSSYFHRLRRMGLVRMHWVTEWQRRGVPHLHLACWFRGDTDVERLVVEHWLASSEAYRPRASAQTCKPITGFDGWAKYVAKHSARGAQHYQRNVSARPDGWEKSGRIWGKRGDWPTIDPLRAEVPPEAFYRLRRLFRGWRKAQAGVSGSGRLIRSARSMLRCHERRRSSVRGVSEWIDQGVTREMLAWLIADGFHITIGADGNERIATRLREGVAIRPDRFQPPKAGGCQIGGASSRVADKYAQFPPDFPV